MDEGREGGRGWERVGERREMKIPYTQVSFIVGYQLIHSLTSSVSEFRLVMT